MDSLRLLVTEPHADHHLTSFVLGELVSPTSPLNPLSSASACGLLRDVVFGLSDLLAGRRRRALVAITPEQSQLTGAPLGAPWELALERRAELLLVSLFRQGACPEVAQWEQPLTLLRARQAMRDALARMADALPRSEDHAVRIQRRGLATARQQLVRAKLRKETDPAAPEVMLAAHSATSSRLRLSVRAPVVGREPDGTGGVSRSDLHALLFRGRLTLEHGEGSRHLDQVHLFPLLEQLLAQVARALSSAEVGAGYSERRLASGFTSDMQMTAAGVLSWRLSRTGSGGAGWLLPRLPAHQLAAALETLGRDFSDKLLALDPSQRTNLRLTAFGNRLARVGEQCRRGPLPKSQLNVAPESYRAFAEAETPLPPQIAVRGHGVERLRYTESWRADVPGIDLRSFFLVGNAVLVGSNREMACIERDSGALIWRQTMPRAASVLTSVGLVRLSPRGDLTLHDLRDGQPIETLQLAPSVGGTTRGTVIRAPGLPNLLLVADGAEHLTAIDLDAVEVRWRRPLERLGPVHLRRAGKLVVVTAGSSSMLALDLLTGEVVWRRASAHRYRKAVVVDQNSIFALASGDGHARGMAVQHIDPWTGEERWSAPLEPAWRASGPLLACTNSVAAITQDGERRGLVAFERQSGAKRFFQPQALCRGDAACMAFDDHLIANGASGELVAIDANSGETRYRHVFASRDSSANDRPDSLKPVLRAGALFVPQTEVYVVRPHDGSLVGTLPSDIIADAMRVDERCGVYVAEQSGYVAAYHPGARLRLIGGRG